MISTTVSSIRFIELPQGVFVRLTARPEVLGQFGGWKPKSIEPTSENNLRDMSEMLLSRLGGSKQVAAEDVTEAAKLILDRSAVRRNGIV